MIFGAGDALFSRLGAPEQLPWTQDTAAEDSAEGYSSWSEDVSPNYVRLLGKAEVDTNLSPGAVNYLPLDSLGRTQGVDAAITHEMLEAGSARKRARDMPEPSGWPKKNFRADIVTPTGDMYSGYFWNRSHLLAKSLGGADIIENLVTGTRMQNVGAQNGQGGMDVIETALRDWIGDYPDTVAYFRARAIYEADELIPRSVIVDVLTSDGHIDEKLEIYNAAKGYSINYYTGEASPTN